MLYVVTTGQLHIYAPNTIVASADKCPAPCCDIACKVCTEEARCMHSTHGENYMCVVDRDTLSCIASHPVILYRSDCRCSTLEKCKEKCGAYEEAQKQANKRKPGSRKAGVQKARFLERSK